MEQEKTMLESLKEILSTQEGRDVLCLNGCKLKWKNLYNLLKECRWRDGLNGENHKRFSMDYKMSKVSVIKYLS